ncbi:cyclophilin-like fold protein [Uliginosibacterium sediminicola]|uniref:Cyclophilin-like fold protein n=1 Tax=Uliginosibacterium sediminicola TaxID=2024550 RepID=A0ABU9Z2X5_9RHOO
MTRRHLLALAALLCGSLVSATAQDARPMKIRLLLNGQSLRATLYDNPSARDFYSLLPLTLTLEDYAATEKIAYPPRKLSTRDAPEGFTPSAGDISYYAPWGNLALFHKSFRYSSGLVSLGKLDSGVELLKAPGKFAVQIERVE